MTTRLSPLENSFSFTAEVILQNASSTFKVIFNGVAKPACLITLMYLFFLCKHMDTVEKNISTYRVSTAHKKTPTSANNKEKFFKIYIISVQLSPKTDKSVLKYFPPMFLSVFAVKSGFSEGYFMINKRKYN